VKDTDQILVLENGQVIQQGSFETLAGRRKISAAMGNTDGDEIRSLIGGGSPACCSRDVSRPPVFRKF
jgi:hypothetical protein